MNIFYGMIITSLGESEKKGNQVGQFRRYSVEVTKGNVFRVSLLQKEVEKNQFSVLINNQALK